MSEDGRIFNEVTKYIAISNAGGTTYNDILAALVEKKLLRSGKVDAMKLTRLLGTLVREELVVGAGPPGARRFYIKKFAPREADDETDDVVDTKRTLEGFRRVYRNPKRVTVVTGNENSTFTKVQKIIIILGMLAVLIVVFGIHPL